LREITIARADGSYPKKMAAYAKTSLIALDDWGLDRLTREQSLDLLELLEDRHGLKSTLVAAQVPIDHWHEIIGDPTLADAILDRLVHSAHKIQLKGESMRKKYSTLTQERSKKLKSKSQRRFAPMKWPPCTGTTGRLRSDHMGGITGIRNSNLENVSQELLYMGYPRWMILETQLFYALYEFFMEYGPELPIKLIEDLLARALSWAKQDAYRFVGPDQEFYCFRKSDLNPMHGKAWE
jgi:hypothetical protein